MNGGWLRCGDHVIPFSSDEADVDRAMPGAVHAKQIVSVERVDEQGLRMFWLVDAVEPRSRGAPTHRHPNRATFLEPEIDDVVLRGPDHLGLRVDQPEVLAGDFDQLVAAQLQVPGDPLAVELEGLAVPGRERGVDD